ncbi:hypothetical protein EGW08_020304 [Elysia chlorotica]|uniref:Uncharacterized protein n=1 Tax=Elysia chlorotica TaxID=188477 RepID=A0A433SRN1_ELYCH|nr:hypothetical protein EGW08_020304 [Elysia chlorotica]
MGDDNEESKIVILSVLAITLYLNPISAPNHSVLHTALHRNGDDTSSVAFCSQCYISISIVKLCLPINHVPSWAQSVHCPALPSSCYDPITHGLVSMLTAGSQHQQDQSRPRHRNGSRSSWNEIHNCNFLNDATFGSFQPHYVLKIEIGRSKDLISQSHLDIVRGPLESASLWLIYGTYPSLPSAQAYPDTRLLLLLVKHGKHKTNNF